MIQCAMLSDNLDPDVAICTRVHEVFTASAGIFLFIFILCMFTHDSLFNSNELLSMRILPSAMHLKGAHWQLAIFITEGLVRGSNSVPFDPELDALTTRPRIHVNGTAHSFHYFAQYFRNLRATNRYSIPDAAALT